MSHPPSSILVNHGPSQQRRIRAMEMRCNSIIPRISNKNHVTNEEVCAKIQQANGPHEDRLAIINRRKLQWYCHVSRSSGLAKTILQGTVKGGGGRQRRQRKRRKDNIRNGQAWSSLSPRGREEERQMEKTLCEVICGAPTTTAVKGFVKEV